MEEPQSGEAGYRAGRGLVSERGGCRRARFRGTGGTWLLNKLSVFRTWAFGSPRGTLFEPRKPYIPTDFGLLNLVAHYSPVQ